MSPKAKCTGKKGGCNALLPEVTPIIITINGVPHVVMVRKVQPLQN